MNSSTLHITLRACDSHGSSFIINSNDLITANGQSFMNNSHSNLINIANKIKLIDLSNNLILGSSSIYLWLSPDELTATIKHNINATDLIIIAVNVR